MNKTYNDHITGFKKEIANAQNISKDAFFTWFDEAENTHAAFVKGAWDFSTNIASKIANHVALPHTKTVVEIGYGGGRLLAAAARHFKNAIGIDIHPCQNIVTKELRARGVHNTTLITTDGKTIPLMDASVDVVYSFIVLQHVEKIEIFRRYITEVHRILKPKGVAVLYFGRYCWLSINKRSRFLYFCDRIIEKIVLNKGFKEIPAPVNCINLLVSLDYAKKMCRRAGFSICRELVSKRRTPQPAYGLQHGLVLRKI